MILFNLNVNVNLNFLGYEEYYSVKGYIRPDEQNDFLFRLLYQLYVLNFVGYLENCAKSHTFASRKQECL